MVPRVSSQVSLRDADHGYVTEVVGGRASEFKVRALEDRGHHPIISLEELVHAQRQSRSDLPQGSLLPCPAPGFPGQDKDALDVARKAL